LSRRCISPRDRISDTFCKLILLSMVVVLVHWTLQVQVRALRGNLGQIRRISPAKFNQDCVKDCQKPVPLEITGPCQHSFRRCPRTSTLSGGQSSTANVSTMTNEFASARHEKVTTDPKMHKILQDYGPNSTKRSVMPRRFR